MIEESQLEGLRSLTQTAEATYAGARVAAVAGADPP